MPPDRSNVHALGVDCGKDEGMTLHTRNANLCIIRAIGKNTSATSNSFRLYLLQLVTLVASEEIYRGIIADAVLNDPDMSDESHEEEGKAKKMVQITANAVKEAAGLSEQIMASIVNIVSMPSTSHKLLLRFLYPTRNSLTFCSFVYTGYIKERQCTITNSAKICTSCSDLSAPRW